MKNPDNGFHCNSDMMWLNIAYQIFRPNLLGFTSKTKLRDTDVASRGFVKGKRRRNTRAEYIHIFSRQRERAYWRGPKASLLGYDKMATQVP